MLGSDLNQIAGVGIDIESVAPFRSKNLSTHERFFRRVFSEGEIQHCQRFKDPSPHYAARFCAKEALVKASSALGAFRVTDFEVIALENGAPQARIWKIRPEVEGLFGHYEPIISISHTEDTACAVAVWVRKAPRKPKSVKKKKVRSVRTRKRKRR